MQSLEIGGVLLLLAPGAIGQVVHQRYISVPNYMKYYNPCIQTISQTQQIKVLQQLNKQYNCIYNITIINPSQKMQEPFRNPAKRDQLINEQRKKLEQLRLQTESQNTKLLKIQQKQRQVQTEYQNQKKNMEETLAKLALEAENFANKQIATAQEFQAQKEQIFADDRKRELYVNQKIQLVGKSNDKRNQIVKNEQVLATKKVKLAEIREQIKKHQIFQDFLKEVKSLSEDFNSGQFDQFNVMAILDRYFGMKKKKQQLSQASRKLQIEKQRKVRRAQALKKQREQKKMQYTSKVKDLKQLIDKYSEQNIQLTSELQGRLNQNGERQIEIGQIVYSIRGLYFSIVGSEEKNQKTTLEMLDVIKEERKKLKEYLELFQKKTQQKKI